MVAIALRRNRIVATEEGSATTAQSTLRRQSTREGETLFVAMRRILSLPLGLLSYEHYHVDEERLVEWRTLVTTTYHYAGSTMSR